MNQPLNRLRAAVCIKIPEKEKAASFIMRQIETLHCRPGSHGGLRGLGVMKQGQRES